MAKNLSREFATMDEDERRRFAGDRRRAEEQEGRPDELNLDEPRDDDHTGRQYARLGDEVADPEHRDGMSALLDDEQHKQRIKKQRRGRKARRRQDGGGNE